MPSTTVVLIFLLQALLQTTTSAAADLPLQERDTVASYILQGIGVSTTSQTAAQPTPNKLDEKLRSSFGNVTNATTTLASQSTSNIVLTTGVSTSALSTLLHANPTSAAYPSSLCPGGNCTHVTWTVPANGSGPAYATNCNNEWASYSSINTQLRSYGKDLTSSTALVKPMYTASLSTICSGNTQMIGNASITAYTTLYTTTYGYTQPLPPKPTCTLQWKDCTSLESVTDFVAAACSATYTYSQNSATCRDHCYIAATNIQVVYSPPTTTTSRDLCGQWPTDKPILCPYGSAVANGSKVDYTVMEGGVASSYFCQYSPTVAEPAPTGQSVFHDGYTYYDDLVYVSIQSAWAYDDCSNRVGQAHTGHVISLPSSSLYSVCTNVVYDYFEYTTAYPYNYGDLSGYLPASAWNCLGYDIDLQINIDGSEEGQMNDYYNNGFFVNNETMYSTQGGYTGPYIYQNWYRPNIAVPPQIRTLDPAWADCEIGLQGYYDPPHALSQASTVAGPSVPSTPSPSPAQQVSPTLPPVTSTAGSGPTTTDPSHAIRTSSAGAGVQSETSGGSDPDPATAAGSTASGGADPAATIRGTTGETDPVPTGQTGSGSDPYQPSQGSDDAGPGPDPAGQTNTVEAIFSSALAADGNLQSQTTVSQDPESQVAANTILDVGGVPVTIQPVPSGAGAVVDGSTFLVGTHTTLANGQVVSVNSQGVAVGGSFVVNEPSAATSASSTGGSGSPADPRTVEDASGHPVTIAADSFGDGAIVDGTYLAHGASVTLTDGEVVSADSRGVFVGSSFVPYPSAIQQLAATTVKDASGDSVTIVPDPSVDGAVIDGHTVRNGGAITLSDGEVVSVNSQGVYLGSSVVSFPSLSGSVTVTGTEGTGSSTQQAGASRATPSSQTNGASASPTMGASTTGSAADICISCRRVMAAVGFAIVMVVCS